MTKEDSYTSSESESLEIVIDQEHSVSAHPADFVSKTEKDTDLFDLDIERLDEKPWRHPGADITDYFNYGFDEESWKTYCSKQKQMREENKRDKSKRDKKKGGWDSRGWQEGKSHDAKRKESGAGRRQSGGQKKQKKN